MGDSSTLVTLVHGQAKDTSCAVHRTGATIISWKVDDEENIFVSSKAVLDGSKPIRGGVPVCFPSFGPWEFGPQHGFARSSNNWKVDKEPTVDEKTGDVTTVLILTQDDSTSKVWDFKFNFVYSLTLTARSLQMSVDVSNNSDNNMEFTFALHTYYNVPDVTACRVTNLKGLSYVDKTDENKIKKEEEDEVKITGFTDRVYQQSPDACLLRGLTNGRTVELTKTNLCDTVVWNPWIEKAASIGDLGDEDYKRMICVEAVNTSNKIELKSGEHYKAIHTLTVKD